MSGIAYPPPLEIVPIFDVANYIYATTSGSGFTSAQAKALFLQKTVPDTATATETFSAGLKTNSITPLVAGDPMTIGSANSTVSIGSILNATTISTSGSSQTQMTSGLNTTSITASGTLFVPTITTSGLNPTSMTSGITAPSLTVNNIAQSGGTIASTNIVVSTLKVIGIKDNTNSLGSAGQYLSTNGSVSLWATIPTPNPAVNLYQIAVNAQTVATIPTGIVRATVVCIGPGGSAGNSPFTAPTTYMGGAGGGGACAIVYDIFISPAQRLTITRSSTSYTVQLTSTATPTYYTGGASNSYPFTLCVSNVGGNGTIGSLAAVGTGGDIGGTATGNSLYLSSLLSGTNGSPIVATLATPAVTSLGGGNLLPTGIARNPSYGEFALGSTLTKLANNTSPSSSVAGIGGVLIYTYSY